MRKYIGERSACLMPDVRCARSCNGNGLVNSWNSNFRVETREKKMMIHIHVRVSAGAIH